MSRREKAMNDFERWWKDVSTLVELKMSIYLDQYAIEKWFPLYTKGLGPLEAIKEYYGLN